MEARGIDAVDRAAARLLRQGVGRRLERVVPEKCEVRILRLQAVNGAPGQLRRPRRGRDIARLGEDGQKTVDTVAGDLSRHAALSDSPKKKRAPAMWGRPMICR